MKIISNKTYQGMKDDIKSHRDMYNQEITELMLVNKDYELQIEEILNRLKEMISPTNAKMGRDKYRERIKDLIIFIQGKQR